MVHANARQRLCPPQEVDDGMLFTSEIPELTMDLPREEELQVAVLGPMCAELAIGDWWDKFRAIPFPRFKDELKRILTSAKFQPKEIRVRRDRRLTWRGEELDDARVVAYIKVPTEHVKDLMSKSGRHGLVIDRAQRAADVDDDLTKVKLPADWSIADALAKLDVLSPQLRKHARGVIPNFKGYSLRVEKQAEAQFIRELTPEIAEELGDALGMQPNSTWVIKGVPREATKATIIKTFAAVGPHWAGWRIMPVKTLGQPRGGKASWIVKAEDEPPRRDAHIAKVLITIDRFHEPQKVTARAAPWFKIKPEKADTETCTTRSIWADEVDDDQEDIQEFVMQEAQDCAIALGITPSPQPHHHAKPVDDAEETEESSAKHRRIEASERDHPTTAAGGGSAPCATQQQPQDKTDQILLMLQVMQKDNEKKDAMIAQLQDTIRTLQATIGAMQAKMDLAALAELQAGHGQPAGALPSW